MELISALTEKLCNVTLPFGSGLEPPTASWASLNAPLAGGRIGSQTVAQLK